MKGEIGVGVFVPCFISTFPLSYALHFHRYVCASIIARSQSAWTLAPRSFSTKVYEEAFRSRPNVHINIEWNSRAKNNKNTAKPEQNWFYGKTVWVWRTWLMVFVLFLLLLMVNLPQRNSIAVHIIYIWQTWINTFKSNGICYVCVCVCVYAGARCFIM